MGVTSIEWADRVWNCVTGCTKVSQGSRSVIQSVDLIAKARQCDVAWIRSVVEQCRETETACFVKQLGANPVIAEAVLDEWGAGVQFTGSRDVPNRGDVILRDRKGGNPDEWPTDLRVRELPAVRS